MPTTGDDTLSGTSGDDVIDALAGNDIVNGLDGADSLFGNDGDDALYGDNGDDTLDGGAGSDIVDGGAGNDVMTGGASYDSFYNQSFLGGFATDHITDFEAGETLTVGSGALTSREPEFYSVFIGLSAFSGAAGEIRYFVGGGVTTIEVDTDGDANADYITILDNGEFTLRTSGGWDGALVIDAAFGGAPTGGADYIGGASGADLFNGGAGSDSLQGGGGDDTLNGEDDDDFLYGMDGDDLIDGGLGNDYFDAGRGDDTVIGGAGIDTLTASFNYPGQIDIVITDTLIVNNLGSDSIVINGIEEVILSQRLIGDFDDVFDASQATLSVQIFAGAGDDVIIGGLGNDFTIEGDSGRDTMTGGTGTDYFDFDYLYEIDSIGDTVTDFEPGDRLDFQGIETAFFGFADPDGVDLTYIGSAAFTGVAGEMRWYNSAGQTIVSIDKNGDMIGDHTVTLTNGEFILQESFANRLTIFADTLATAGADSLVGSNGDDSLDGDLGADTIYGLSGVDDLYGDDGDDLIFGGDGIDELQGGAGLDTINGGAGDDLLEGGTGSDVYTGGSGRDTFSFDVLTYDIDFITDFEDGDLIRLGSTGGTSKDPGPDLLIFIGTNAFTHQAGEARYSVGVDYTVVEVDLDGDGGTDQQIEIQNGAFDLRTTAPNGTFLISTNAFGTQTAGDDFYYGSTGDDTINGGDGSDALYGMEGDDVVNGGDGDDFISEHFGNDTLDGGAGHDELTHFYGEPVDLTITDSSIVNSLSGETDLISNFEAIFISNRLGPPSNDTLDGSAATITVNLHAGAGNDIVRGGSNNDSIEGDNGTDTLSGGLGADVFDFDYVSEISNDNITDFEAGDIIDLASIQQLYLAGDNDGVDITYIGTAAFNHVAGELRYVHIGGQTYIQFDVDGDGIGDNFILLANEAFVLEQTGFDSARLRAVTGPATAAGDIITGVNSADVFDGLDGDDRIFGLAGSDMISGGAGSDTLFGGDNGDSLFGGADNDVIDGGAGNDQIDGGDGADLITSQSGRDSVIGGVGDDSIDAAAGDDTVYGGADKDGIYGGAGADFLDGDNGNDTIQGGTENDTLFGGNGFDYLLGDAGADFLDGGALSDTLVGGDGSDVLIGGDDNDRLLGGAQHDAIFADAGNDIVDAGTGFDTVSGGTGRDSAFGGSGDDSIEGDGGNDTLTGGTGGDTLLGGAGYDVLQGDDGDDVLDGGALNDVLFGNAGNDTFRFSLGGEIDTLRDFTAGAASEDVIQLVGFSTAFDSFAEVIAVASDDGVNTTINFGGGDMLVLRNVLVSQLHADDFTFG